MLTPCTITLDLGLDEDAGTTMDMAEAVQMLTAAVGALPVKSLKLAFSTADVEGAQKLEGLLEQVLSERAYGVTAEITRKSKRGLARKVAPPPPTPIEREIKRSKRAKEAEPVEPAGVSQIIHVGGPGMFLEDSAVAVLELPAPAPLDERIFEALYRNGPSTAADLAAFLHVDREAMDVTLTALQLDGRLVQNGADRWWFASEEGK